MLRTAQTFSLKSGDQALLDQVIGFYQKTLKASPEALKYLDGRGLGNMELIERFRLGYANRTLAYRLAPKQYKAGAELRSALQRVGILRESGHEHLNGSIVMPLFQVDEAGDRHVVGAYGRKLLDNLRAGTPTRSSMTASTGSASNTTTRWKAARRWSRCNTTTRTHNVPVPRHAGHPLGGSTALLIWPRVSSGASGFLASGRAWCGSGS